MASSSSNNHSYCGVCSRDLDDEILNDGEFMIQCDACETWYHGRCVELEEFEAADIDHYHCPSCLPQAGPSQLKQICNTHRYDYSDSDADDKPTENGTIRFVAELKKRKFSDVGDAVTVMDDGHLLTSSYLDETNFRHPILVHNSIGLGLIVPPSDFTADDVEKRVGGDRYVDVVDVYTQHSYKMRLRTFLNFFRQTNRPKLYNLISLEFSDTELSKLVKPPDVVEELSWVEQYWPKPMRDDLSTSQKAILNEHITARPEVTKFCLIGMAESYTDFHIDFGGTSVFYHVLSGSKVFYLIEPSEVNLRLFENWQRSTGSSERFFGDLVSKCSQLVLKPGQTFFIPTGWIHAVYTPEDSLVIGGNFLHSFNIGLQIRIYEMEKQSNTAEKFMFPHFELMNWYAGVHFLDVLKELNEEKTSAKPYLLDGMKALLAGMKIWIQRNQAHVRRSKLSGQIIIETMTCNQVLKQLERAVKLNEKMCTTVKPKKKKRIEMQVKIKEPLKTNIPSTSAILGPIKVALPLPKLKVPSKDALERSKGCPKSPAKMQQQAADIVNAVAAIPVGTMKKKSNDQGTKKIRTKHVMAKYSTGKNGHDEKSKPAQIDQPLSDVGSRGTDLDSAPPTPKWSEDTDESVDRVETTHNIGSDGNTGPEEKSMEPEISNVGTEEIKKEEATSGKKVFGFSLLDMHLNDPKSPTSPPIGKGKESGMLSPTTSAMVPLLKLETRISPEKLSHASLQVTTSSHGRLQKPSHHVMGKKSNSKAEFYPDLGYCRQDDEFVYPSLSDSEPNEANPRKRRKFVVTESSPKKIEDATKPKPNLTILTEKIKKSKLKPDSPKKKKSKPPPIDVASTAMDEETITPKSTMESSKSSSGASIKPKKIQKGTTKQRLANKLKIGKLIRM